MTRASDEMIHCGGMPPVLMFLFCGSMAATGPACRDGDAATDRSAAGAMEEAMNHSSSEGGSPQSGSDADETLRCPAGTSPIAVPVVDASGNPISPPPLVDEGSGQVCARPDGTLHGPQRAKFRTGEREHEGAYEEGQKVGRWTWWDREGNKVREGEFVAGVEHGPWLEWRGGKKTSEGRYDNGKQVGDWVRWYDSTGHKQSLTSFTDGVANGLSSRWHDNGHLAEEGRLEAGKRVGRWVSLNREGGKIWEGHYTADKQEGVWTWWRPDGSVERSATFKDGVEVP